MKRLICLTAMFFMLMGMRAEIVMGSLFQDHMVLQQDTVVHIWGWTNHPGKKVTLKTSWSKQKVSAQSAEDGRFDLQVKTPKATFSPQTLELNDGEKCQLQDILIGEVWLASGQSNMEMPLEGFGSCPVEGAAMYIAEAGKYAGRVRLCTVEWRPSGVEENKVGAKWEDCNPLSARSFCAVAYFFALRLTETLNVPVGVINSSLGATRVEGWTPRNILTGYGTEDLESSAVKNSASVNPGRNVDRALPMVFYNGMIHPLVGFSLKGFLFYQGEANINEPATYRTRFVNMVREWRRRWDAGDLPFYYVEICPYDYYWAKDKNTAPLIREAQYLAQYDLPNMGMVCTNDLVHDYEYWQIHPCMKKEVGDRLCLWALGQTYAVPGIDYRYPEYESMTVEKDQVILTFRNAHLGFNRRVDIKGFELCGEDGVWHPSTNVGTYDEDKVSVKSKDVPHPVAVRYAFQSWSLGNLKGGTGLPVIPFRTNK